MAKRVKTVAGVAQLIAAEEMTLERLRSRRQRLAADLDALAEQIASLRGETRGAVRPKAKPAPKRGRPKKKARRVRRKRQKITLRQAIGMILGKADKPLRASEIAQQLSAAGYKTKSKDPANLISAVLGQTKEFRRVGKGIYTVTKKAAKPKAK